MLRDHEGRVADDFSDLVFDYSTGALPEPVALAVATHVALNAERAAESRQVEAIGGALIEGLDGESIDEAGLDALLDRLDDIPCDHDAAGNDGAAEDDGIPSTLRPYLHGRSLDALAWKTIAGGVEEFRLPIDRDGFKVALLRIKPGRAMPAHTHKGEEYTVVLKGAYHDGTHMLTRGDMDRADAARQHQPVSDAEEGCICLIVLDAPVRFTGRIGRLLNPFVRH